MNDHELAAVGSGVVKPSTDGNESGLVTVWDVLKEPCLRKRVILLGLTWLNLTMSYNGLNLASVNHGGDIYLNMAIAVGCEAPCYLFVYLFIDRFSIVNFDMAGIL